MLVESSPTGTTQSASSLAVSVCEFATVHTDGTYTLVRGGIEIWNAAALPFPLQCWVFLELPGGSLGLGEHPLSFVLSNSEGVSLFSVAGTVRVDDPNGVTRLAGPVVAQIQAAGVFSLRAAVAGYQATRRIVVKTLERSLDEHGGVPKLPSA